VLLGFVLILNIHGYSNLTTINRDALLAEQQS